jgi:predicted aspartyl protease
MFSMEGGSNAMFSRRGMLALAPALGFARGAWAQDSPAPARAPSGPLVGRFAIVRNRPWTPVFIQGQGPFRFVIDTGASVSIIDPELAARLQLPRLEDAQLQGATAERTVEMFWSRQVVVAETLRQRGAVVFAAGNAGGDFDGILPGAMLTSANTEIDFAAQEFRIFTDGPPDRTGYVRLPLVKAPPGRRDDRLVVRVRLDDRPVDLLVDTGGTGSVLLSGEYVGKNKLWDRYPKWATSQGQGMLTAFNLRLVRARSLELGPTRFARPVVHLTDPFNPPGDAGDGVLGMDVLRRFTLSTDPVGKALWLKPNAAIDEPFRYNRAGLEASLRDGRCVVQSVQPGGPAAKAGVRVGDLVPAVTAPQEMARFDWYLSEGPGTSVEFELDRMGMTHPVKIVLAELL